MNYPYYKDVLPIHKILEKNNKSYLAKLSFIIKKDEIQDIKKYLDFRNKLDKFDMYILDTDTGSIKKKEHNFIYIWTILDKGKYEDYSNFLKIKYPEFAKKIDYEI